LAFADKLERKWTEEDARGKQPDEKLDPIYKLEIDNPPVL